MGGEARLRRDVKLPFQELEGQSVVVVPARQEMHELDEVATFLWRELGESRSVVELLDALCGEFDVEPARAEADVRAFVALLEVKGLLIRG